MLSNDSKQKHILRERLNSRVRKNQQSLFNNISDLNFFDEQFHIST